MVSSTSRCERTTYTMHRSNSNSSKYKQSLINRFELEYKSVSVRDLQKLSAAMYRLLAVNDKLMENLQTLPMHYRAQINKANNQRTQRQIVSLFVDYLLCLFS
nr:PKIP-1 [Helicoverpa SNPV AC53]